MMKTMLVVIGTYLLFAILFHLVNFVINLRLAELDGLLLTFMYIVACLFDSLALIKALLIIGLHSGFRGAFLRTVHLSNLDFIMEINNN